MELKDKIIIPLDMQTEVDLDRVLDSIHGHATFVKVGMELFYTFGPSIVTKLKQMGFKVFLDLKLHDIPNTVGKATKTLTKLGADILNVHAAGGLDMMVAARQGMEQALAENPKLTRPKLIAVTQLTSTTEEVLRQEILIELPLQQVVIDYARLAMKAGLDGVVCSPLESEMVKYHTSKNFLCITPGVRPAGADVQDQKRVTTPAQAIRGGSDYLVIGRPITGAVNPAQAYQSILEEIQSCHNK